MITAARKDTYTTEILYLAKVRLQCRTTGISMSAWHCGLNTMGATGLYGTFQKVLPNGMR